MPEFASEKEELEYWETVCKYMKEAVDQTTQDERNYLKLNGVDLLDKWARAETKAYGLRWKAIGGTIKE